MCVAPALPTLPARLFPQLHSSVASALRAVLRREGRGRAVPRSDGHGAGRRVSRRCMLCMGWALLSCGGCAALCIRVPMPSTLPAGPHTPSTLLRTRQQRICMAAMRRGTTRWPPQPRVRRAQGARGAAGLAGRWMCRRRHTRHPPLPAAAFPASLHVGATATIVNDGCMNPVGCGEATHAGGAACLGRTSTAAGPAALRVCGCVAAGMADAPAPAPAPPPPLARCGTRRTAACCTARSRRSGRRGWPPFTSRTGPRWAGL